MNCSDASSLFSARVDNELDSEIAFRLEDHLEQCSDCQRQWTSFYSTIRMVRGLPKEETHPAFVGQVLDRVRAYEAEGDPFLEPADRPLADVAPATHKVTWFEVVREQLQSWLQPAPALAVGSLALGVVIGVFAVPRGQSDGGASMAEGAAAPAPTTATRTMDSSFSSELPFADIADEIQVAEPMETWNAPGTWNEPTVGSNGLQQQVRLGNDAPRITF